MPLGIGHFSVGVFGAVLILMVTRWHTQVSQDGYLLIGSGLWAVMPDIGQAINGIPQTDQTSFANLFWGHYWLDTHSFFDSLEGTVTLGALMVASLSWLIIDKRIHNQDVVPLINQL